MRPINYVCGKIQKLPHVHFAEAVIVEGSFCLYEAQELVTGNFFRYVYIRKSAT